MAAGLLLVDVIVVGEGQTEETFIDQIVAPPLAHDAIFLYPRLITTSRTASGGALTYQRVLRFLRNTLREREDTYVTTFFDLYRIDNEFPGWSDARAAADPLARAAIIEANLGNAVIAVAGCREDRFFAHVQPHEFEALLFSDVEVLAQVEPEWPGFLPQLRAIRGGAQSPEHIDDDPETHPSKRLSDILRPRYRKALHGPRAAGRIGLPRLTEACLHFGRWVDRVRALPTRGRPY